MSRSSERMRLCRRLDRNQIKCLLSAVVTLVIFLTVVGNLLVKQSYKSGREYVEGLPLLGDGNCNVTLGNTLSEDLEKINSYSFPKAQPYLKELFTDAEYTLPQFPTFVTAFDWSHYTEGTILVENVNTVIRKRYTSIKFVIYDLGLTSSQRSELQVSCNCEIRDFPYDRFPKHVQFLGGYTFKPLAIQLIAKEHPFVMWMDASVRFTQPDLDAVFAKARRQQVMAVRGSGPVAERTNLRTFKFLGEEPCIFRNVNEIEATFIIVHVDKFVMHNFLKPWVSCALTKECMMLGDDYLKYGDCHNYGVHRYFVCHRFDQAILSILLYRLFHSNIEEHRMDHTFFQFCRGPKDNWILPTFINKWIIGPLKCP